MERWEGKTLQVETVVGEHECILPERCDLLVLGIMLSNYGAGQTCRWWGLLVNRLINRVKKRNAQNPNLAGCGQHRNFGVFTTPWCNVLGPWGTSGIVAADKYLVVDHGGCGHRQSYKDEPLRKQRSKA